MKKIIIAIIALVPVLCLAQKQSYQVKVQLKELPPQSKAYLVTSFRWSNQVIVDSAKIKDNRFLLSGHSQLPLKTELIIDHTGKGIKNLDDHADRLVVYLDTGKITINGTDSIKNARITGSSLNVAYAHYKTEVLDPGDNAFKTINENFRNASAEEKADKDLQHETMEKIQFILSQRDSLKTIYIQHHPDNYLSLVALKEIAGDKDINIEKIDPLFNSLSARLRATAQAVAFSKIIEAERNTAVGSMAPDFTEMDVDSTPVSLSSFRGKYVLVDFWASWCGPCRGENPNVLKAYNIYKNKNFTIIGVSLDNKKNAWLAAIKADGLTWTQVSDLNAWKNKVAVDYRIKYIPQNFLLDPSGKIIAKNIRGEALEKKLAEVLK